MTDRTLIICPGCCATVSATRTVCPGCGRCLNCGVNRVTTVDQCPKCGTPYCECCGRCLECSEWRYSDIGPCACGHPNDPSRLESLIRRHTIVAAEKAPLPAGWIIAMIVFAALIICGIVGFMVWFP